MNCLLCCKSYPEHQIECWECSNNLTSIKPYSPHLSQIIRMGEEVCRGNFDPAIFQLAVRNLIKRLDIATDNYFKLEAQYSEEDLKILESHLNSIMEQSEFLTNTLKELRDFSFRGDFNKNKIYTALDKAKIAETMLLKASNKLKDLTEDDMINIGKQKGINIK